MDNKKNILTYAGLKKLEDELEHLKVVKRKEVSQKIKEAREQSTNCNNFYRFLFHYSSSLFLHLQYSQNHITLHIIFTY